jgi:hypothetical protein
MLEFAKSVVTRYSEHPLLFSLLLVAGLFAGAGVVVEQFVGNGVAAAFLVIYALLSAFLGAIGYAILVTAKVVSRTRRRVKPM